MNESYPTYRDESYHYETPLISHMFRIRHDSFHIYAMISRMWNDFKRVKLFHTWVVWDTIHFTYVQWFHVCEMISNVWNYFHTWVVWDTIHFTYVKWFHICEMISDVWNYFTHESYETRFCTHMWNDFRCVKLFQMCEIISHMSRMRHDSFHIWDMTYL